MIAGVIFDLGDTLVSQEPLAGSQASLEGAEAILPMIREHSNSSPAAAQIAATLGERFQAAMAEAYESSLAQPELEGLFAAAMAELDCSLPADQIPRALDRYFWAHYQRMRPVGEVIPTLTLARGLGLKLGLLANVLWGADLLRARLRSLGIANLMSAALFSSEIGWLKPFPGTYREILRRMGVEPAKAVMVGDDPLVDVIGAQRAGLRSIWKRPVPATPLPDGVRPNLVIEDIRQLLPAVAELM